MGKMKSLTLKEAFAPISEAIKAGRSSEEMLSTLDQLKQSMRKVIVPDGVSVFQDDAVVDFIEVEDDNEKRKHDSLIDAFTYAIPYVTNKSNYYEELADKARELIEVASQGFGTEEHVRDLTCHVAQYAKDLCADLGPSPDNTIGDIPNLDCEASKRLTEEEKAAAFTVSEEPIKLMGGMKVIPMSNGWAFTSNEEEPAPADTPEPAVPTAPTQDVEHLYYSDYPNKYLHLSNVYEQVAKDHASIVEQADIIIGQIEQELEEVEDKLGEALDKFTDKKQEIEDENSLMNDADMLLITKMYEELQSLHEDQSYYSEEYDSLMTKLINTKQERAMSIHLYNLSMDTSKGLSVYHKAHKQVEEGKSND